MTEPKTAHDTEVEQLRAQVQNLEAQLAHYQEVERLRARLQNLEAELASKEKSLLHEERSDRTDRSPRGERTARQGLMTEDSTRDVGTAVRDASKEATDEASRLFRGITFAWMEALRSVADTASRTLDTFSNTYNDRTDRSGRSPRLATEKVAVARETGAREETTRAATEREVKRT